MKTAYVNISLIQGAERPNFSIFTTGFQASQPEQEQDFTSESGRVMSARSTLELAIATALKTQSGFPTPQAETLRGLLRWTKGLPLLLNLKPDLIRFTMTEESCALLPEMVPIDTAAGWLDSSAASYRTIGVVGQEPRQYPDLSLAILCQEDNQFGFPELAEDIQRELQGRIPIISIYRGGQLISNPVIRDSALQDIFHQHRAVLFLGHLKRSAQGEPGGWLLTPNESLLMTEMQDLLARPPRGMRGVNKIPQVIFASCCASAWRDKDTNHRPPLVYPKVFLDTGVEFFIGTWMDIVLPPKFHDERKIMSDLIVGFFRRWADQQDEAVFHLFEAKRDCGFHLLTSLYQIYTVGTKSIRPPESEEADNALVSRAAEGALLVGLSAGDQVGEYTLSHELWVTPYARSFWATSRRGKHIVQVLFDEWQDDPKLIAELQSAIKRLKEADLSPGHLVPSRAERVAFSRGGQDGPHLHILVYDRPDFEIARNWVALTDCKFDPQQETHFQQVLELGLQMSLLLAELHGKKIKHGNLDPGNMVLYRDDKNRAQVLIKDAWIARTRPGRCTKPRYAAPEETASTEGSLELKTDCWGLGVILFELATGGKSPFEDKGGAPLRPSIRETLNAPPNRVPEAVERVVRECLVPSPTLRPSAEAIARRLALSHVFKGGFGGEFEHSLLNLINAGQRLICTTVGDYHELDSTLDGLAALGHRVFIAAEGEGVIDRNDGSVYIEWISAEQFHTMLIQKARESRLPDPPAPSADYVASLNAEIMLDEAIRNFSQEGWQQVPVLVIVGAGWWSSGSVDSRTGIRRLFKLCQSEYNAPVILLADQSMFLEPETARLFHFLLFPALSPTDLFESILAFPISEGLNIPDVGEETAIDLAQQLNPCANRELTYILRTCALQHGVIDMRALEIREQEREQLFKTLPGVSYIPSSKLPQANSLGLPAELKSVIDGWCESSQEFMGGGGTGYVPRRLMIEGPSGYGKTHLGLLLGRLTDRPVVRIDAAHCMQNNLGESERTFRATLGIVSLIPGAIVLLDDVDRFFGTERRKMVEKQEPTVVRMGGILEQWIDIIPPVTTAVFTCTDLTSLPPQMRRRVELHLPLAPPFLIEKNSRGREYRRAVFTAVFRRMGLENLATDRELMERFAKTTYHDLRTKPLPHPLAMVSSLKGLADYSVKLETGADIEHWVRETILFSVSSGYDPAKSDFWLERL